MNGCVAQEEGARLRELGVVQAHAHFPSLIDDCPDLTAALVHHMLDRSRDTRTAEMNDDRLQSIGRVASGLAHELNNPASAATRHAQSLAALLTEAENAARALAGLRG